ncbi:MAG TPA: HIT family protein [Phycisphaerales bacterium]|nr:HIT family protein [Phycisphaerales bacterium]
MSTPPASPCPLCVTVRQAAAHPLHLLTLQECVVMLGDNQGCQGWCVCVLREHVEHMDDLPIERQQRIFAEVARVARAVRSASVQHGWGNDTTPPRINYECLGNVVPHVHWHIVPRHANDPTPKAPVWGWSGEQLTGTLTPRERADTAAKVRDALQSVK